MDKLFIIMVGGYPEGAHVEVHDIRFAIGRELRDCFPKIKAEWWGGQDRLHLDAWGALEWADGHDVVISRERPEGAGEMQLFFVNLGGYREDYFGELHENVFVVAANRNEAKVRALKMARGWISPHRDTLFDVEALVNVGEAADTKIWLVPNTEEKPFRFEARYLPKLD
ncbi:DUF1543 domain-containing protein [Parvularcula lutaonensis]|uniref:DUF1543 domain-containing protein n=1 Tax=Parvularcula lutaonensis TaxID=491923 RepID=A0ABV7MCE1_9PROT|nr:DUF1543 domain-containing protein [Parvularcula lutaonensis]GGY50517.1 hypothetical protein GCM10007148_19150 [Parvularcula lutaonensis]